MRTAVVTDVGPGNHGAISAANLQGLQRDEFVNDAQRPEYQVEPTDEVVCIDGREAVDGESAPAGYAAWQTSGSRPITDTAVDMMVTPNQTQPQSVLIVRNTQAAIASGTRVTMHGDQHKGRDGCGANFNDRRVLRSNGENIDVVVPTVWFVGKQLGLDAYITEDDVVHLITTGAQNAENDDLFDVTPAEKVDLVVAHGGAYQVLAGEHREKVIAVTTGDKVFDKDAFAKAHPAEDGENDSAFPVALGVYKQKIFEEVTARGGSEREAALRVAAAIAFNVGVAKELTAEEQGGGEALPVVVM